MWRRSPGPLVRMTRRDCALSEKEASGRGRTRSRCAGSLAVLFGVLFAGPNGANACGVIMPGSMSIITGSVTDIEVTFEESLATLAAVGVGVGSPLNAQLTNATGTPFASLLDRVGNSLVRPALAFDPAIEDYDYESLKVVIGDGVEIAGFAANTQVEVANDQVEMSGDVLALCEGLSGSSPASCDWVFVSGNTPDTLSPAGIFALDESFAGGDPLGVQMRIIGDSGVLSDASVPLQPDGPQAISDFGEGVGTIDLIDLTLDYEIPAQIRLYLQWDQVAITYEAGSALPALGLQGGAWLILSVLCAGLFALAFPRRFGWAGERPDGHGQ